MIAGYTVLVHALFLVLVILSASTAQAVPGVCRSKESCPYRCCRGTPGQPSCLCSLCCNTKAADLGPDDRSQDVSVGGRRAKVYRHRVEFFKGSEKKSRTVRTFEEGIYPIDADAGEGGLLLVCTSAEWGVMKSSDSEMGFCGALRMDGREAFRLSEPEAPGLSRVPVGVLDAGTQALFALTKPRQGGDREVTGYRLWTKGHPSELLPPDGPRTREVLEKFEGRLVLPDPRQGN